MSDSYRPFSSGVVFNGSATAVGPFALTNIDNLPITLLATQRVVIYLCSADAVGVTIGHGANVRLVSPAGIASVDWGIALPEGQTPTVISLGTATRVHIMGEIVD
jgi:hypothetical protein